METKILISINESSKFEEFSLTGKGLRLFELKLAGGLPTDGHWLSRAQRIITSAQMWRPHSLAHSIAVMFRLKSRMCGDAPTENH